MFDCVIVGGGLIGMLTALELAAAGCRIQLIERGATARESSWAGGGILSPLYPWRYPAAVSALAGWSQRHYPGFCENLQDQTGFDPEYRRNGLLILDTGEQAQAQDWAVAQGQCLEILDADGARRCEPKLGPQPASALWLPEVGQVRNPRLIRALHQAMRKAGVAVYENSEVQGFVTRGRQVTGVRTFQGEFSGDCVILAAGAWSGQLLQSLGLALPVKPVRGQMLLFKSLPGLLSRIVLSQGRYLIPRRDGRVLVGSTLEDAGFDKSTTASARAELQQAALRLMPALEDAAIETHWAGLRPGSPTGIPYIGAHPEFQGLYLNTGHFRNGVVLGLASARLLADLLLEREPILNPADYAPARADPGEWQELR